MIALDPRQERDYILEAERTLPPADQTVFHLRALSESVMIQVMDSVRVGADADGEVRIESGGTGTRAYTILRNGLVGWSNLCDASGRAVEFTTAVGVAADESLERLPWDVKWELSNAIEASGRMTEDEVGKPAQ